MELSGVHPETVDFVPRQGHTSRLAGLPQCRVSVGYAEDDSPWLPARRAYSSEKERSIGVKDSVSGWTLFKFMYYDKIVVSSGSMAANTACGLAKRLALRRILCPNTFDPKHPLSDGLHTH